MTLLEHPPKMGVVRVFLDLVAHQLDWLDTSVVVMQGVATGTGPFGSFKIEGARWHLLRQVVAPQLQGKFVPFLLSEIEALNRRRRKKRKAISDITGRFFEQHKVYSGRRRCWERLCFQPLLSSNAQRTQKQSTLGTEVRTNRHSVQFGRLTRGRLESTRDRAGKQCRMDSTN